MRAVLLVSIASFAAADAAAEPVVFSGSLGAGMVGTDPVSIAAAELDVEGRRLSLGLGVALRFSNGGLVERDWDQWRDGARLLRHFLWQPRLGSAAALSLAAGQLDAITVGHGAVVDGVAAGVDLDRQRLGADLRLATAESETHLWVDDLINPEIGALRVAGAAVGPVDIGATVAGDRAAAGGALGTLGVEIEIAGDGDGYGGGIYSDAVRALGGGGGIHLGARGHLGRIGSGATRIGLRVEGHAASAGYVAGWIGPLHVRDRLVMRSRPGGLGGLIELDARRDRLGSARVRLEHRAGRGPGARLELRAPHLRAIQAGAWAAIARDAAAFAAELRVRFPHALFARLEARRQYTSAPPEMAAAIWSVAATFGATLGE